MIDQLLSLASKILPSLGGLGDDLRKEIAQIAHDLHFYGNVFYKPASPETQQASEAIRKHAAELARLKNQIRAYWWARLAAGVPRKSDIEKAIVVLTGLSNEIGNPPPRNEPRKHFLTLRGDLKRYCESDKGRVRSAPEETVPVVSRLGQPLLDWLILVLSGIATQRRKASDTRQREADAR